ncbi:amino acid adenylation domain-containing protein [Aquincola sp. MAHUQ-54]|uniref:Amino acid adenylation domain-containing protein n=1 Tax=Aquincola agrisoli TaxID=3119538 RepID=A0AAW9QBP5_9BURK
MSVTSPRLPDALLRELERLSPEQRTLFERRLAAQGLVAPPPAPQAAAPKRRDAGAGPAPLSFAQQRLWFLQRLAPHSSAYNVASVLRLAGPLDVPALARALHAVVDRHEVLRTAYPAREGGVPVQDVRPTPPDAAALLAVHEVGADEAAAQAWIDKLAAAPFDLAEPPLRLALLRHGPGDHRLLLVTHHIASDRWSVAVFLRELRAGYTAFVAGEGAAPLPPLAIQYADWAAWQHAQLAGPELARHEAWWRGQLGGELPLLDLPLDHPRPPVATDRGAQHPLVLPPALGTALKALAQRRQVTLFMLLLAAFQVWLHRLTGGDDVIVGTEVANREQPGTEPLIGLLVNTLVLRTRIGTAGTAGHPRFDEVLAHVRRNLLDAMAHQALPFEKLVELLNPERHLDQMMPLFQAKFDLQPAAPQDLAMGGMTLTREPLPEHRTKYELRFNLVDAPEGLRGQIEYRSDLFEPATIARMARQFEVLLGGILAAPEAPIGTLPLLDPAERAAVLAMGRTPPLPPAAGDAATLDAMVFAQAARTPGAVAVVDGTERWTYAQLTAAADRLAAAIGRAGVAPGEPVGVCMPRSARLLAALLGVLRSGAAYVPLDPEYPAARLDFIVEDAGIGIVLVDALAPPPPLARAATLRQIAVGPLGDAAPAAPGAPAPRHAEPGRLAYLIYTSGSTGRPKGVAIEHRSAVVLMHWARERFGTEGLASMLASTSVCFDLSVFELFAPLAWGGCVVMAENVLALPRLPAAGEVRFVNTVPSLLQQLLDTHGLPPSVRLIGLAGEPLPPGLVERLRRLPQVEAVYNLYGPSEDTTYSTEACFPGLQGADPEGAEPVRRVPIGRPLPGSQAYVVDAYGEPVPHGVAGELLLGGQGLARGYLGRPALTAERFVPNPFAPEDGAWLYRTGDRVRCLPDGQLEFFGRLDHQVKIRGFRIETGEIEHALREHPDVRDAAVQAPHGPDGQRRLVAHVEGATTADVLRDYLQQRLPSHLVPGHLQLLAALPRLPNGKIDRAALAALPLEDAAASAAPVAPRNDTETHLAAIWQQALKRSDAQPVGVHDNFFALGGHSLLAIEIAARIEQHWGRVLPLQALFQAPTVAQLAARLDKMHRADGPAGGDLPAEAPRPAIVPDDAARHEPFPLTDIQQAYLLGRHAAFELGQVSTHGYREIEATGLQPADVAAALDTLVQRHGMLRAVVTGDGRQRVLPEVPRIQLTQHDLAGLDAEACGEALLRTRERLSHQRFEPSQWPLFQIEASRLPVAEGTPDRWRYHLSFDVLIGDAFSFQLLGRELAALLVSGTLPPLALGFRDCVLAEAAHAASPAGQADWAWWLSRIDELPPAPELPRVQAPAESASRFVRRSATLDAPAWQRVKARAQTAGLTPSAVLLAAFARSLAAHARRPRFTLNLTLFNRPRLHADIDRIVGDFTASLLLACEPRPGESFIAAAQRLQARLWQDLEHRSVSGVRVQRALAQRQQRGGQALFPVVFTSTLGHAQPPAGARPWATEVVYGVSQTSQVLLDHQVSELQGALQVNWDAIDALFPAGLLEGLVQEHAELLALLADPSPAGEAAWTARDAAPAARRMAAWAAYNADASALPMQALQSATDATLLHLLCFRAAQHHPLSPAVITADRTLTHAALAHEALAVAARLAEAGVQPNELVAIGCAKGWAQVVAVLGVLAAGAAYVPIDPGLPAARRAQLVADARARVVLVAAADAAAPGDWTTSTLAIAAPAGPARTEAPPLPPARQAGTDLAYVIYTSGSTGAPKGVMIDHRGAVNTVRDINHRHGIGPGDRVFGLSALNFDLSVWDIFGPLAAGGALVLPAPDDLQQPARWPARLAADRVTVWNTVPALLQLLLDALPAGGGAALPLRLAMLSGDWIPLALPPRLAAACPQARLFSLGGATEASIWSIEHPVDGIDASWRSVPYGRPLAGQPWYVLDDDLRPCPPSVPGELYIAGIGVARGYWGRPALTAERFVPNPFAVPGDAAGAVLYRTGDLGVLRPEGWIEFLGREDHQVKVNGYRIELGEIEAALQRHPALAGAAVAAGGTPPALTAYVVPRLHDAEGGGLLDRLARRAALPGSAPGWRAPVAGDEVVDLPLAATAGPTLPRQSHRRFADAPLALATLAEVLAGLRAHTLPGAPLPKFDYPSAGHLYPLQAWLQVQPGRVDGLAAGWYAYHPAEHRLHRATGLPPLDAAAIDALYGKNRALAEGRAFGLFLVAQLDAVEAAYGERARDFALIEAGHVGQVLMARAAAAAAGDVPAGTLPLGLCALGGTDPAALRQALALQPGQQPVYALMGGAIEPAWALRWQAAEPPVAAPAAVEGLQAWLAERLPAYMLPSRFVVLPSLPLTPNGKLDRQALPAPGAERAAWRAAATGTEHRVAEAWQQTLQVEAVGMDDDFFALGGQSLAALQLLTRLQQAFALPLTLGDLLGALTPAAQAALIDGRLAARAGAPAEAAPLQAASAPAAVPDVAALADDEVDAMLAQLLAEEAGR